MKVKKKLNKKSLLVYLDYNLIVSLHKKEISTDQIKEILGTTNVVFPFSASHLEELKSIPDRTDRSKSEAINDRLMFINTFTKKNYLERRDDQPFKKCSASAIDVFKTITEVAVDSTYDAFLNLITDEQKQDYRNHVGVESNVINNIDPKQIIAHLDSKLLTKEPFKTFLETIRHTRSFFPPSYKWGLESDIVGVFLFLDMLGYWKDKVTDTSNVARFWDSSHCAFASYCDILISNDQRMRLKSQVAYQLLGINTKIMKLS